MNIEWLIAAGLGGQPGDSEVVNLLVDNRPE